MWSSAWLNNAMPDTGAESTMWWVLVRASLTTVHQQASPDHVDLMSCMLRRRPVSDHSYGDVGEVWGGRGQPPLSMHPTKHQPPLLTTACSSYCLLLSQFPW